MERCLEWMRKRAAGVLLHPSALARGGLTEGVVRSFIAWMRQAGLLLWQILPLNPPEERSPYQCLSSFAIHEGLFAPVWLQRFMPSRREVEKALRGEVCAWEVEEAWRPLIARERVRYVLFRVASRHERRPFWEWQPSARDAHAAWCNEAALRWYNELFEAMACQLAAERAWSEVVRIAHDAGVALIGDLPFFVAAHSADVWGNRRYFCLEPNGSPAQVAGVPPDYFSSTGQRWGNPQYDWQALAQDGFAWLRARVQAALAWCDGLRLDHFRGYQAVWSIPAASATAEVGAWVEVPGEALLKAIQADLKAEQLPFIAEDLGIITPEVRSLQQSFHLPGISVLQFGFDGLPDNPHALYAIPEWQLVATGTHDNATTCEWWESIKDEAYRSWILAQLPHADEPMPWPLIEAALASRARWAIIPMADWLGLGAEARFNRPGTVGLHNWSWVVPADAFSPQLASAIRARLERCNRLGVEI